MAKNTKKSRWAMLLLIVFSLDAEVRNEGNLEIQVYDISSGKGEIIVHLYAKDEKLFGDKKRILKAKITNESTNVKFESIPFGEYAVFVFQDENLNGTLDHNFFRIPKEPIGFSNHFVPTILTGRPKFQDMKFTFNQNLKLQIKIK